jgi:hypothetical protein
MMAGMAIMVDFSQIADGILATTSVALEREAVQACREYANVLIPGISVNPRAWSGSELAAGPIKDFLDKHDKHTVLFISFG